MADRTGHEESARESDIRVAQAELAVKEQRIAAIGQTQTQVEQQLMEIGLAKEKDLARHERARLEIEEKRLKSQLGMKTWNASS
jgi:hypothetical protein